MITLTHGTPIRAGSWGGCYYAEIITVEGYASEYREDAAEAVERAKGRGHSLAGSYFAGSSLLGDRAAAKAAAERAFAKRNAAIVLNHGDRVTIESREYTVKIVRGNEATPRNSDPIHFTPA